MGVFVYKRERDTEMINISWCNPYMGTDPIERLRTENVNISPFRHVLCITL